MLLWLWLVRWVGGWLVACCGGEEELGENLHNCRAAIVVTVAGVVVDVGGWVVGCLLLWLW